MSRATSSARVNAWPRGTTSFTSPERSASSAPTRRPVRIISIARPIPTSSGSRAVIPSPATMFQRRSVAPNCAFSDAIRMSASIEVSRPAANAHPFTAAMIGLKMSTRRV
jgi:hypothetical protein